MMLGQLCMQSFWDKDWNWWKNKSAKLHSRNTPPETEDESILQRGRHDDIMKGHLSTAIPEIPAWSSSEGTNPRISMCMKTNTVKSSGAQRSSFGSERDPGNWSDE